MVFVSFETVRTEAQINKANGNHGFRQVKNFLCFLHLMYTAYAAERNHLDRRN